MAEQPAASTADDTVAAFVERRLASPRRLDRGPITLRDMGSFFFGGRVVTTAQGDTRHGDHGYAQFFVPERARNLPLILWHGLGQSGRTWESTPDGRDGFWQILTRHDWPVYIIDQPRRGRAGRTIEQGPNTVIIPDESESTVWAVFRLGRWDPPAAPEYFPGILFDQDPRSVDQFLRQQTPSTGPEPYPDAGYRAFVGDTVAQLVRQVGPAVLVTHSHSGQFGWVTATMEPGLVKAIIGIEPGEFTFPTDDVPPDIPTSSETLRRFMAPQLIPPEQFAKLTSCPILLVYGDNIAAEPADEFGVELWRMVHIRAEQFVAAVNARGGDATLIDLPALGFRGNTHFPMSDLNNGEVAEVLEAFLAARGLDGRDDPHTGPRS
jgi:pimeloyl-ACP methyl ester carboxylesterase